MTEFSAGRPPTRKEPLRHDHGGRFSSGPTWPFAEGQLSVPPPFTRKLSRTWLPGRSPTRWIRPASLWGRHPPFCWNGASGGRAEIRLDTFGKMAHSSHPEYGVNAADTMNALLAFLKQQFIPPRDPFSVRESSCSPVSIHPLPEPAAPFPKNAPPSLTGDSSGGKPSKEPPGN